MKEKLAKLNNIHVGGGATASTWFGVRIELLVRIAVTIALFCVGLFGKKAVLLLMLLSFLICGYDVILQAIIRAVKDHYIGEELIVTLAALLAFVINAGYEAAAVMIIYQAGYALRAYALALTRGNLLDKVDPYPGEVTILRGEEQTTASPDQIQTDDILILHPGDRIPVDCEVTLGSSTAEYFYVIGHDYQKEVKEGDTLPAGAINVSNELRVRAVTTAGESVFARAMQTVADERNMKSYIETALEHYSVIFAPFAMGISILIVLLLLIFTDAPTEAAIHRALVLLILACPTALLASIPFTYLSGLYRSLQKGVLVKGAAVLDSIARTGAVIFDKDDLMAEDEYRVAAVKSDRLDPNVLLKVAAHAAAGSQKSVAVSIVNAYDGIIDNSLIQRFEEFDDGIAAIIDGVVIVLGARETLLRIGVVLPEEEETEKKVMYMALNGRFAGMILLTETVHADARASVAAIESTGCDCILLSADSPENTDEIASAAGIREVYPQCMPIDRLEKIQEIKERFSTTSVLYVGNGATDTSSLDASDIGVCVNGLVSEAAFHTGSVVVMDSAAFPLADAIDAARVTRKTVGISLTAIFAVKGILLLLALFGITYQLWFAAMVDVMVGVAGVLFSTRIWDDQAR